MVRRPRPRQQRQGREVLFEFHHVGTSSKVVAIDPVSGTEVTMVCAPGYSQHMIKQLAARKLFYVINKNRNKTPNPIK